MTSPFGVNALILSEKGMIGIRPVDVNNPIQHEVYLGLHGNTASKSLQKTFSCNTSASAHSLITNTPSPLPQITNGTIRRNYRMAIVVTQNFRTVNGGTDISATAAATVSVNNINAIYEKELAVRFILLAPYVYNSNPAEFMSTADIADKAAAAVNRRFAVGNYDIGHALHNSSDGFGGGGLASLAAVCSNDQTNVTNGYLGYNKAAGWSGSDDNTNNNFYSIFAHEIGHMFSMEHTFNGSGPSCNSQSATTAYEIGGGSTIMAYNGVCADGQNINSRFLGENLYFHVNSLEAAVTFMGTINCNTNTATNNIAPVINMCGGTHKIPRGTPFRLIGNAADANGDLINYSWEQYDEDGAGSPTHGFIGAAAAADNRAPLFRSYMSTLSPVRTFPAMNFVVANNYASSFEPLSTVNRTLNFKLTARDNNAAGGGIHTADLAVMVEGAAFTVTAPNGGENVNAGNQVNVTWAVGGTAAPFCNAVNIKMSIDGGYTYIYNLASGVSNNGSSLVTIPAGMPATAQARIMVESANDACVQFFEISNADFTITSACLPPSNAICADSAVSYARGNANLALGLAKTYGTQLNSTVVTIGAGSAIVNMAYATVQDGNVCTASSNWTREYQTLDITVSKTATYTIDPVSSSFNIVSIFTANGFDINNPCNNTFLGSSGYDNGGNPNISNPFSVKLNACTQYKIVVYQVPGSVTLTFSTEGAGKVYSVGSNPAANYLYTYIAINTSTNQVSTVSAASDFTALAAGSYDIYGVSYNNASVNPNTWVGTTLSQVQLSGCLASSANSKRVVVTSVLAAELLNLQATPLNNSVKLTWQTANEVNNQGFQVERRTATSDNWEKLGFIKSKGKAATYEFVDNTPLSINYYRLRQIDQNGKETLSKVVSVTSTQKGKLTIYPNPVAQFLSIETTEEDDRQVINLLGQTVLRSKATQQLDVSALPSGTYFLKVGGQQARFVKQ
jgi:hypothetical protein